MKLGKILFSFFIIFITLSAFSSKKEKGVYAFGFSASFTDTVVYHTEIQMLDSVELKRGFLPKRDLYSYQLKNYLEYNKGQKNRTCMIYFSEDKQKLVKEKTKVLNKYKKNNKEAILTEIPQTDFTFKKAEE